MGRKREERGEKEERAGQGWGEERNNAAKRDRGQARAAWFIARICIQY